MGGIIVGGLDRFGKGLIFRILSVELVAIYMVHDSPFEGVCCCDGGGLLTTSN
jgi:hypothetical protein